MNIVDREHVTYFIWKNSDLCGGRLFTSHNFSYPKDYSKIRLTLDYESDFRMLEKLITKLGYHSSWIEYVKIMDEMLL